MSNTETISTEAVPNAIAINNDEGAVNTVGVNIKPPSSTAVNTDTKATDKTVPTTAISTNATEPTIAVGSGYYTTEDKKEGAGKVGYELFKSYMEQFNAEKDSKPATTDNTIVEGRSELEPLHAKITELESKLKELREGQELANEVRSNADMAVKLEALEQSHNYLNLKRGLSPRDKMVSYLTETNPQISGELWSNMSLEELYKHMSHSINYIEEASKVSNDRVQAEENKSEENLTYTQLVDQIKLPDYI